jgi:hypothetical protein
MSEEKKEEQPNEAKQEVNAQNQDQSPQQENPPTQEQVQNENKNPENQTSNPNPQEPQHQEEEKKEPEYGQNNEKLNENEQNEEKLNENQEEENDNGEEENDDGEEEQQQQQQKKEKEEKRNLKRFNKGGIEDIQLQIQEMTKKIEHEKINLRIITERLTQKEKTYNELQGKPVTKTNEEKEKERREHKKAVKNHKLSDPIIRKKGKEKEFYDEQIKNQKAYDKSKTDFEKLTCDINELVIGNKDLKQQIIDLRKRKVEALKQLENIMEENK